MNNTPIPTVIVSRPGIMRQSLQALLADYGGIDVVCVSGDGLSALSKIRQCRPLLIIIDLNLLEKEAASLVSAVKTEQPNIRCLIYVQAAPQRSRMLSNGADAVILRDSPRQVLQSTLDRLARMADEP